ncbi:MAG: hypothetical protein KJ749_03480 [Planctomycetes bacterium]|nr:hypothetical protein [Planctomycetota bacterium]
MVTVHFQVWDVDDPFDQLHGPGGANDVANVSLIDNNMARCWWRLKGAGFRRFRPWWGFWFSSRISAGCGFLPPG